MKTIWLPVVGYEGLYAVSYGGYVKNLATGKRMKPFKNEKDYLCISLTKNGKCKKVKLHRVVAISHIPNPENKEDVNHKKGRKWDCRASQLEWMTHAENVTHSWETGLKKSNKGKFYNIKSHGKYRTKENKARQRVKGNRKNVKPVSKASE